ncbi:expressed unknown protein [Seminavis robusta]|uniref:Uncharacterized protein n=1 Tax=Seminavis robusta TaxID=568900 RepID=A0A9N8HF00_9STRA|nr:expressed unknown protein [Seminavis robusta]|eukprot:Sro434_g142101.1  (86) ;mRNA; r:42560-42817
MVAPWKREEGGSRKKSSIERKKLWLWSYLYLRVVCVMVDGSNCRSVIMVSSHRPRERKKSTCCLSSPNFKLTDWLMIDLSQDSKS